MSDETKDGSGHWVKVYHLCELPTLGQFGQPSASVSVDGERTAAGAGSTWACDECGAAWKIKMSTLHLPQGYAIRFEWELVGRGPYVTSLFDLPRRFPERPSQLKAVLPGDPRPASTTSCKDSTLPEGWRESAFDTVGNPVRWERFTYEADSPVPAGVEFTDLHPSKHPSAAAEKPKRAAGDVRPRDIGTVPVFVPGKEEP